MAWRSKDQGSAIEHPEVWQLRPELDALAQAMTGDLEAIPGAWVEDKGLTLSVHFRRVPAASVPEVKARLIKRAGPGIDAGRLALDWQGCPGDQAARPVV